MASKDEPETDRLMSQALPVSDIPTDPKAPPATGY